MPDAGEKATPIALQDEYVVNPNSLQVRVAQRYLFSSTKGFSFAQKMVCAYPALRRGLRFETN